MHRIAAFLTAFLFPIAAYAGPEVCDAAAKEIDASLRAFQAPPEYAHPSQRISIRNAVAQTPAAGLNYGSKIDADGLKAFPLAKSVPALAEGHFVHRAGGDGGLVMVDTVAGTARCHSPAVFTTHPLAPLKVPDPGDPFALCMDGGVALGAAGGSAFYAQTRDGFLDTDELKVFPLKNGALSKACTIAGSYQFAYEVAESFCKDPSLCNDYPENLSSWANAFRTYGGLELPSLTRLAQPPAPQRNTDELPLFGAKGSSIVPIPFRFGGSEAWFAIKDDPRVNLLRLGAAKEGPENMANWKTFTLAVLYKDGEPQASFAIEKQRGIVQRIAVYYDITPDVPPAGVAAAIYRTAAGVSGDYSNGASIFADPLAREHYMSSRLRALIAEMYKRANGEVPGLDFDPVTDSQDPVVTGLTIAAESENSREASVRVEFQRGDDPEHPVGNPQHVVLRYLLVREDNAWKLDDIVAVKPNQWRVSEIAKGH